MASPDLNDLHHHVMRVRVLAKAADSEWFSLTEMVRTWHTDYDTRSEQASLAMMLQECVVEHLEKIETEIEDLLRRGFRPATTAAVSALPPRAGA